MAFTPVLPVGGLAGLRFIDRTFDAQFAAFSRSPDVQREIDYFLEHAGEATTAEALVSDRRLLAVALGAFGLEDEVGKGAFIRKILDDGTLDPKALANRLTDPAWAEFSQAMGYGDLGGLLTFSTTRDDIVSRFRHRQFERAIGDVDVDIRLALNFRRRIGEIAASPSVEKSGWFKIMGSQPLRQVIEGAYGLPDGFGQLDIDLQRTQLEDLTESKFGARSPATFAAATNLDDVIRRFLVAAQLKNGPPPGTPGMVALAMLQSSGLGDGTNLIASNL